MKILVQKAARGDELAFETLVKEHQNLVYNVALRLCENREDALDISQEAFIKAWRALPKFRCECNFSTWIYRITVNAAKDYLKKENSAASTLELSEVDDVDLGDSPDDTMIKEERILILQNALDQLPLEHKEIVTLRDIEGYSYEEISEMLSLEIGTVKSRINRARSALRKLLGGVEQK